MPPMTLLALALVAYLPGALLYRLPVAARPRRADLPADERLFWAVVLSIAWSLAVTMGLAAWGAYRFPRLLLVNAALSAGLLVAGRGRLRFVPPAPGPRFASLVPAALVVLGLWLYFPPAEYVMGGKDPGTYMNEGIQIAQGGGLVIHDPTVARVPSGTRDLFFPSHNTKAYYSIRFMGFFITDPAAGTVVGQFPHLFPASIAIGYGLNGLSGARQASGSWAILGALAVFFLGVRLLGRGPAAVAVALLMVNVITVWFARYPNAEVAMQSLVFAAMLALARALVDGDRFFAPVAAVLYSLLLFLRIDAGLAVAAAVAAILGGWVVRARIAWTFWPVLAAGAALASLYYLRLMSGYLAVPAVFVRETVPVAWAAAAAIASLAAWWGLARVGRAASLLQRFLPVALGLALIALAVYAFFFREAAGRTAWHDAAALRTFAWYVGPSALVLGVAALLTVLPRWFWRDPGFFLTTAAFAVFFFYKIRIVPEHFWMTRRFLPVILPACLLLAAGCAWWLVSPEGLTSLARRVAGRVGRIRPARDASAPPAEEAGTGTGIPAWRFALSVALMLVVLSGTANGFRRQTGAIRNHVEYAGLIPRLEQLAQRFADDDLVIVESRSASDLHVLALPLAYIYAKPVLVLNTPRPDKPMMEAFIADARTRHREVFFLGSGGTDLLTRRIGVEPVGSDRFQVPEYESPRNAYPAGARRKEFDYGIYRFVDVSGLAREPSLVVGQRDDLQVVRFHAKERDTQSGRTYRWTRDVSYVSLLNVTAGTRTIVLSMANGRRPARVEPAVVEVSLNDLVLGSATVGPDLQAYEFTVPADLAAAAETAEEPARLRLRSSTWSPRKVLGAPDDRDLGVMLWRVDVR